MRRWKLGARVLVQSLSDPFLALNPLQTLFEAGIVCCGSEWILFSFFFFFFYLVLVLIYLFIYFIFFFERCERMSTLSPFYFGES